VLVNLRAGSDVVVLVNLRAMRGVGRTLLTTTGMRAAENERPIILASASVELSVMVASVAAVSARLESIRV
jgi:hypothetical protein